MTLQASLLLLAVSVFSGLELGVAIAAPDEPPSSSPIPLQEAAVPPSTERLEAPVNLSVEQAAQPAGSGGSVESAEASGPVPADVDPWAEAFAESARLRGPVPTAPPPYPLVINSRVQYFIDLFTTSRREVVSLWFSRSGQYLGMIRETLRNKGLPEELAFVAMIESGFNPRAVSRAGAKGLWQFMAGTARRYGLRVDRWVDERLDPEKSTTAAAAYLRDLHRQFGSWALAKAAYNAGEVKVVHAIRASGSTDFWALARTRFLRTETKEFVPAIHAATVIGRDPARWGFDSADSTPAETSTVRTPPRTSLRTLAAASGVPFATLRSLNPVLVRAITPPGRPYNLRVPAESADSIAAALATPKKTTMRGKSAAERAALGPVHVARQPETVGLVTK